MLEWAAKSGISKFVSYGNRCDVDEADLIRYLGEDQNTKVIAVYLKGFGNGRARALGAFKRVMRCSRCGIEIIADHRENLG